VKRNDASFGATVARFQEFLGQNQYPENILWLMPGDVLLSGKRFVYVRIPISAANEMKVREIYDEGVANGRGLCPQSVKWKAQRVAMSGIREVSKKSRRDFGLTTEA
jgi:hypothetical protein